MRLWQFNELLLSRAGGDGADISHWVSFQRFSRGWFDGFSGKLCPICKIQVIIIHSILTRNHKYLNKSQLISILMSPCHESYFNRLTSNLSENIWKFSINFDQKIYLPSRIQSEQKLIFGRRGKCWEKLLK